MTTQKATKAATLIGLLTVLVLMLVGLTRCTEEVQPQPKPRAAVEEPTPEPTTTIPVYVPDPEPEPEPEDIEVVVVTYHFTSATERTPIVCNKTDYDEYRQLAEVTPCGMTFEGCGAAGEHSYYCQVGVHVWVSEEKVKVKSE